MSGMRHDWCRPAGVIAPDIVRNVQTVVLRAAPHELERGSLLPADVRRKHVLDDVGRAFFAGDADGVNVTRALERLARGGLLGARHFGEAPFSGLYDARVKAMCGQQRAQRAPARARRMPTLRTTSTSSRTTGVAVSFFQAMRRSVFGVPRDRPVHDPARRR